MSGAAEVRQAVLQLLKANPQQSLPEEIGHVSVGTVDRTKTGQQSHECDSNHTNTAD